MMPTQQERQGHTAGTGARGGHPQSRARPGRPMGLSTEGQRAAARTSKLLSRGSGDLQGSCQCLAGEGNCVYGLYPRPGHQPSPAPSPAPLLPPLPHPRTQAFAPPACTPGPALRPLLLHRPSGPPLLEAGLPAPRKSEPHSAP